MNQNLLLTLDTTSEITYIPIFIRFNLNPIYVRNYKASRNDTCSMCSICLEPNDNTSCSLTCNSATNHSFHISCIRPWLEEKSSCPLCRTAFS